MKDEMQQIIQRVVEQTFGDSWNNISAKIAQALREAGYGSKVVKVDRGPAPVIDGEAGFEKGEG